MRIDNKITLILTGLIALLILCLSVYIYYLSALYTKNEFYSRLQERAILTAQIYLKQEELSTNLLRKVRRQFMQSLPEEVIRIYNEQNEAEFIEEGTPLQFPESVIEEIRHEKYLQFSDGNRQVVGLHYSDNQGEYVILTSAIDRYGASKLRNLQRVLIVGFFFSILVVLLTGRFVARQALKPMSDIVKRVQRISGSNLHLRVEEGNGKDEIAELAITFNKMLERLESTFEVQRTFVSNASHELRTPLTAMIGEIEVMLTRERDPARYKEVMASVLHEAEQLKELINNLLNLAQVTSQEAYIKLETIRLDEVLFEQEEEMHRLYPESQIVLKLESLPPDPEQLVLIGNKQLFSKALFNLIDNARKYSENKPVFVDLNVTAEHLLLNIKDQGIGISQAEIAQILQPFYRAGNVRSVAGHGIGLALADKIIQMHGGQLHFESELHKGTTVTVTFPLPSVTPSDDALQS